MLEPMRGAAGSENQPDLFPTAFAKATVGQGDYKICIHQSSPREADGTPILLSLRRNVFAVKSKGPAADGSLLKLILQSGIEERVLFVKCLS